MRSSFSATLLVVLLALLTLSDAAEGTVPAAFKDVVSIPGRWTSADSIIDRSPGRSVGRSSREQTAAPTPGASTPAEGTAVEPVAPESAGTTGVAPEAGTDPASAPTTDTTVDATPASPSLPAAEGAIAFPADAGVVDVKQAPYRAKGDGVTDDTNALRRAFLDNDHRDGESGPTLSSFAARTVYLPAGTYRITDSILVTGSSLRIVGAGEGRTTIRLDDRAAGFGSASNPRYVLKTGVKLTNDQANSGFANHLENLTIDVGAGNPGAMGVRFDVANSGGMHGVTIRSSDPGRAGHRGITFETTPGPAIVRDVTVEGFDTGIYLDRQMPNNLVLTDVRLRGQRQAGVVNDSKNVVLENLTTTNVPVAVKALTANATTILIDSSLGGQGGGPAVEVAAGGFLYARDVQASGFGNIVTTGNTTHFRGATSLREWATHDYRRGSRPTAWTENNAYVGLNLPVEQTPDSPVSDPGTWANVLDFGGVAGSSDIGPALQRAIDSGAEVVYFPYGRYTLSSAVEVRGEVDRIDFMYSELVRGRGGSISVSAPDGATVWLENMASTVDVQHNGAGSLVVRHVGPVSGTTGSVTVSTGPSATGDLFVEDWGPHSNLSITRPINVWARQVNREGQKWSIAGGATVWVLGDNVETADGRGHPDVTIANSTYELIGGAWDNLGDSTSYPASGAAVYQATDSRVSMVIPGLMRNGGVVGHWLSDRRNGTAVGDLYHENLVRTAARNSDQRASSSLYVSPS